MITWFHVVDDDVHWKVRIGEKDMLIKYYDSTLKTQDILNAFRLFDDSTSSLQASQVRGYCSSSYRTETTDRGLSLSIDLPGVKATDLTVQVVGNDVKVSGKVRGVDFDYAYRLNKEYDPDTAEAVLDCGVLTLLFQRSKRAVGRKIEVKTPLGI